MRAARLSPILIVMMTCAWLVLGVGIWLWGVGMTPELTRQQSVVASNLVNFQHVAQEFSRTTDLVSKSADAKMMKGIRTAYRKMQTLLDTQIWQKSTELGSLAERLAPSMADLNDWLTHGVSGYEANAPVVLTLVADKAKVVQRLVAERQVSWQLMIAQTALKNLKRYQQAAWLALLWMTCAVCGIAILYWSSHRNRQALLEVNQRLEWQTVAFDTMSEGVIIVNPQGRIEFASNLATTLVPGLYEQLQQGLQLDAALTELEASKSLRVLRRPIGIVAPELPFSADVSLAGGGQFRVSRHIKENGTIVVAIQDISDFADKEQRLQWRAYRDPLTKLYNRNAFNQYMLPRLAKPNTRLALVMIDLDLFKVINDTYGHAAGDEVLKAISRRLENRLKSGDIAVRMGGDEFVVVIDQLTNTHQAMQISERLLSSLSAPVQYHNQELSIGGSIGVAVFPDHGGSLTELLNCADAACYEAKQTRNRVRLYDRQIRDRRRLTLALEAQVREALAQREFALHYQPQWDVRTGSICGMEALVRWDNADLGQIDPIHFLPMIEQAGLMPELAAWTLEQATQDIMQLHHQGLFCSGTISVNLWHRQINDPGLLVSVDSALSQSGLAPERLILEIQQASLAEGHEHVRACCDALVKLGVNLFVDDFGSGESSFSNLRSMPIHGFKVDQDFVADLLLDERRAAAARAVVAVAASMNVALIAEGVETAAQARSLRELGCFVMQGHYLSKALSLEDMTNLLRYWGNKKRRFTLEPDAVQAR